MKAGPHAASHQHPHEQIVWMLKGRMDFRIGSDRRSMIAGDLAVIPGNVEHEGFFPEDSTIQDWGVTWDEIEPYYDMFEHIYGVHGKAGNIEGEIR